MKLGEWADQQGIARHTAYRWFKDGKLPVPAQRVGNLILVDAVPAPELRPERVALYARVASHDQRADLDAQQARLALWAARHGVTVAAVTGDVDTDKALRGLLADASVTRIVTLTDAATIPGLRLVRAALSAQQRHLDIVDAP